jgi:O-ureido-D-serine cyclo-ligase
LIRDRDGRPCVLELELTEPSLYLSFEPGSAQRFTAAALKRLASSRTGHQASRGAAVM